MRMDMGLDGFAELERQLVQLEMAAQKKVLRKAVRQSALPMVAKMKSGITSQGHIETGLLYDSVKIKTSLPKNATYADAIAEVGVYRNRSGQQAAGRAIDPPVYAYWLEFGVEPHATGKSSKRQRGGGGGVQHPGFPAQPFIRPVFDGNVQAALNTQKTVLSQAIDRALNVR